MAVMTVREAWDAIARAETEVLGDHLTFASIEPILTALAALPLSGVRGPQEWRDALRKLMKESAAVLALAEPELRDSIGNTNLAVFKLRIKEAGELLSGSPLTDAPQHEETNDSRSGD